MAGVLVVAILYFAGPRALRNMGYLPPPEERPTTDNWELVRIADDRESAEIRVDECWARYDGVDVRRAGRDARLTVFVRLTASVGRISCPKFAKVSTHVIEFGFVLPSDGRVLDKGPDVDEMGNLLFD